MIEPCDKCVQDKECDGGGIMTNAQERIEQVMREMGLLQPYRPVGSRQPRAQRRRVQDEQRAILRKLMEGRVVGVRVTMEY